MTNRLNILAFAAIVSFLVGFGIGCTVGFDAEQSDAFPCEDEDDCVAGFECGPNNLCRALAGAGGPSDCIDADMDGYGVGEGEELLGCSACRANAANCVPDCDDSNENVNPGVGEVCDGVDNDCDGDTDEPTVCETAIDCPSGGANYATKCENSTCVYTSYMTSGSDPAECKENFECVDGTREPLPAACL